MRVIFLGTPDFAVLPLKRLIEGKHEVIAVITQPDRPKGRSGVLTPSPVKATALKYGVPILQFERIRNNAAEIRELKPDIMVTCAYGQILTQEIIDIAPHGIINIHGSLLPKYRGAAPIQWSIINGDAETGITVMRTDAGIDTGDIMMQIKTAITPTDTAETLFDRLSEMGADIIETALDKIADGTAVFVKQPTDGATYVKMMKKADGEIDFSRSAKAVDCLVRGANPWPCAYTELGGSVFKIWSVNPLEEEYNGQNGEIIVADAKKGLIVKCGKGGVQIDEMQAENGKRMSAKSYLIGHKIETGLIFGKSNA